MNDRSKTGIEVLQAAAAMGLLGDVLLRETPWGLNALLFVGAFTVATTGLLRRWKPGFLTRQTVSLLAAMLFFAAMFPWRDAIQLKILDTIAIIAAMSVLMLPRLNIAPAAAGVIHMAAGFVWSSLNALFAPIALLVADVDWKWLPRSGWTKHLFSVVRGLLVAVPILFVFGALFMAADAAYEGIVRNIFNVDLEVPFTHLLLTCIFAWLTAGYFRGILIDGKDRTDVKEPANRSAISGLIEHLRTENVANPDALPDDRSAFEHLSQDDDKSDKQAPRPDVKKPRQWQNIDNSLIPPAFTFGAVEIGIILGLVDLLFLSFVIVQVPYLFGGMDLVQTTPDFSLAEYARRGFGELVAASALVMPLLLLSHWLLRRENPFNEKLFRWLASVQIVLVFIIMASAAQRLFLLTGDLGYGLTVVRLYSMIFMAWLAIIFAWFALTVIRGRRQYFAWGALWAAFLVLGTTHILDPDDLVVRTNLSLLQQGRPFDPSYVVRLSDDAVPALIESIPYLDPGQQCIVRSKLSRRSIYAAAESDIRTWNLSRWNARVQLQAAGDLLDLNGCPEMKPWSGPKEDL